jgi:hypothetical protein
MVYQVVVDVRRIACRCTYIYKIDEGENGFRREDGFKK